MATDATDPVATDPPAADPAPPTLEVVGAEKLNADEAAFIAQWTITKTATDALAAAQLTEAAATASRLAAEAKLGEERQKLSAARDLVIGDVNEMTTDA